MTPGVVLPGLLACAAVAPSLAGRLGRNAGYPLAAVFAVGALAVGGQAPRVLTDEPVVDLLPWIPSLGVRPSCWSGPAPDSRPGSGCHQWVIGLTVVSNGTSLPELAIRIDAARSGSAGLATGSIVGTYPVNLLSPGGLPPYRPVRVFLSQVQPGGRARSSS